MLGCSAGVTPGSSVHVTIAIADRGSNPLGFGQIDSALFVAGAVQPAGDSMPFDVSIPELALSADQAATSFKAIVKNTSSGPLHFDDSMLLVTDSAAGTATGEPITSTKPVSKMLRPGRSATLTMRWQHGGSIRNGVDRELRACVTAGGRSICAARAVLASSIDSSVAATLGPLRKGATTAKLVVTITNVDTTTSTFRPNDLSIEVSVNGSKLDHPLDGPLTGARQQLQRGQSARYVVWLALPKLKTGDVVGAVTTMNPAGDVDLANNVSMATRVAVR